MRRTFFLCAMISSTAACIAFAQTARAEIRHAATRAKQSAANLGDAKQSAATNDIVKIGDATIIVDETGRRVAVPAEVKRVVTLAPDLTETIYALGLEGKLAGDTDYCDTPAAAKLKPHVGGPQNPNLEAIVALHPDLVLATTSINRSETVDALAKIGVAVYTANPHTVRGMLASTKRIAELIGAAEQGAALVARGNARLDAIAARLADEPLVHVLFVVWENPLITIGQNTFIADALRCAGAESVILAKQNWPQISFEEVVRLEPDYIVFSSSHTGFGARELAALRTKAGWKDLRAVQLGHIAVVSEEVDRPSPGLVDAIEQLARQLHPNAFRDAEAGKVVLENGNMKMENGEAENHLALSVVQGNKSQLEMAESPESSI